MKMKKQKRTQPKKRQGKRSVNRSEFPEQGGRAKWREDKRGPMEE